MHGLGDILRTAKVAHRDPPPDLRAVDAPVGVKRRHAGGRI